MERLWDRIRIHRFQYFRSCGIVLLHLGQKGFWKGNKRTSSFIVGFVLKRSREGDEDIRESGGVTG